MTLVLLNGKRRHVSALLNINGTVGRGAAAVDMNMIPALAIKAPIDVLRDGASSQYGSDAIAGVIDIELKTASDGGRAQVSYGKYVTTLDGVASSTASHSAPTASRRPAAPTAAASPPIRTASAGPRRRDADLWRERRPAGRQRRLLQVHRRVSRPQLHQPPGLRPQAQLPRGFGSLRHRARRASTA
ncbi:hypothetical protein AB5I41_06955 [Sphingomonas sp. MMS24-JH45]